MHPMGTTHGVMAPYTQSGAWSVWRARMRLVMPNSTPCRNFIIYAILVSPPCASISTDNTRLLFLYRITSLSRLSTLVQTLVMARLARRIAIGVSVDLGQACARAMAGAMAAGCRLPSHPSAFNRPPELAVLSTLFRPAVTFCPRA